MPRRIPDYPDAYAGWNLISSYGSLVSTIGTLVWAYLVYDLFVNGKVFLHNPWSVPAYFTAVPEHYTGSQEAHSLEWVLNTPTPLHSFNMLPVQS